MGDPGDKGKTLNLLKAAEELVRAASKLP